MAGVKSVQMFHDNSVHNKEDREGLSKLFKMEYSCQEQYDHQLRRLERRQ